MIGYALAITAIATLQQSDTASGQSPRSPIPPLELGTSYDPCDAPKSDDRAIEVRDLRVAYNKANDEFIVSACLASDRRDMVHISPDFVMHTRGSAMIDFHGQPRIVSGPTHRAPKGVPYHRLPASVTIPAHGTALTAVRPEVLVIVTWTDEKGAQHSEQYSVPFTFIP